MWTQTDNLVFSDAGGAGRGSRWSDVVWIEGCVLLRGARMRQLSVPDHKIQTTDGSGCRGKLGTAIERERGEEGEKGRSRRRMRERFLKCFSAPLTAGFL